MAELGHLESDRLALVTQLAKRLYDAIVALVIADIKALPDKCRQSGDDSKLKDVWEEFKDQLQNEQSFLWDAYEQMIQDLCSRRLAELDANRQCLLWLWSEGYLQRWVDEDKVHLAEMDVNQVAEQLYQHVCNVAANEPLIHELEDDINSLWSDNWPGRQFVELDNIDDPGKWLSAVLGEPPSLILRNLSAYEEHLAVGMAEEYLAEIDRQGFDMPWSFGEDPSDSVWIAECRSGIQKEFVAFLRHWRERAQDLLERLPPPSQGRPV